MKKIDPRSGAGIEAAFERQFSGVFLRTPYNYDAAKASDESGLDCSVEPSLTKQSFAKDADINEIVRRFGLDGQLPENVRQPVYGDFTWTGDFHQLMNSVSQAHESFDTLPARVRSRFHNDPQEFVQFCLDDKNAAAAAELGLVRPEVLEERRKALEAAALQKAAGGPPVAEASPPTGTVTAPAGGPQAKP